MSHLASLGERSRVFGAADGRGGARHLAEPHAALPLQAAPQRRSTNRHASSSLKKLALALALAASSAASARCAPAPAPSRAPLGANSTAAVAPWPPPAPVVVPGLGMWPQPTPPVDADPAAVAAAERLLGFGPLTTVQRLQIYGEGLPYLPSTVGTLVESYARVRAAVSALPESGDRAPLAVVYVPPAFQKRREKSSKKRGGVIAASMDIDSIPPDDVADDSATHAAGDMAPGAGERLAAIGRDVLRWGGGVCEAVGGRFKAPARPSLVRPANDDDLAFMSALDLAALVKARLVTSVELVELFTARMRR